MKGLKQMTKPIWQKFWEKFIPKYIRTALINARILEIEFGHMKSAKLGKSVDKNGDPIPWHSYPAIEYLGQLDFSDKQVFEYGSGNSSLYWAGRAKSVTSIEDNEKWYHEMKQLILPNNELRLVLDQSAYVDEIKKGRYDVIIIDGEQKPTRIKCTEIAPDYLNEGGMIILDNSDWCFEAAELLRSRPNLIEVDFAGFVPIIARPITTSIFLDRRFSFKPKGPRQPMYGIGSVHYKD